MNKTFKKVTALFATALLAMGLTACNDKEGKTESATSSTIEQLKQAGKVRIGVFSDKPPFGYVDSQGKSQGFDVEIAKAITKDLLGDENKAEYVLVEAANRVEYLTSNKVDIILANFTVTPARAEVVDFAKPYMKVALGVVCSWRRMWTKSAKKSATCARCASAKKSWTICARCASSRVTLWIFWACSSSTRSKPST